MKRRFEELEVGTIFHDDNCNYIAIKTETQCLNNYRSFNCVIIEDLDETMEMNGSLWFCNSTEVEVIEKYGIR